MRQSKIRLYRCFFFNIAIYVHRKIKKKNNNNSNTHKKKGNEDDYKETYNYLVVGLTLLTFNKKSR